MPYREELPENCPPDEAAPLEHTTTFYRLVKTIPPSEEAFDSRWEERSDMREQWEREKKVCDVKGVSLFDTAEAARTRTRLREHSQKIVCAVRVTPQCGPIKQGTSHHHTWWPLRNCKILALCQGYTP